MIKRLLRIDWLMFLSILALMAIGVVCVRSAGSTRAVQSLRDLWKAQLFTGIIGIGLYWIFAFIDYRIFLRRFTIPSYVISIIFLIAVLLFGAEIYGGKRWLWFFQPSEVTKFAMIATFATYYGIAAKKRFDFTGFLIGILLLALPALLILREPDLGTTLVLVPAALTIMCVAKVWLKGLIPLLCTGVLFVFVILSTIKYAESKSDLSERERIYNALPLKTHQINRLRTFLFPESDPYGSGWNLKQAKICIGSGSFRGKGIGKSEQKFLGYLPPSVSMNDFIFAVFAEETGFIGSVTVLSLFSILLLSLLRIAAFATDDIGRLFVIGCATLIFAHVYVNLAMSVGLMPITGLPLPFISAGRTFLIVLTAILGIAQSVNIHKELK